MKRNFLIIFLLIAFPVCCLSEGKYGHFLKYADAKPFILIDKRSLTLTLVDGNGDPVKEYGIACAVNYGNKQKRGDHKTPEGVFHICQILNAKGLSHDFGDGKGPVVNAYGPWFLRLDVPGFIDIGIHGTHLPESIGTRTTEGCIRLTNEDITDLKGRIVIGTPVIILPDYPTRESESSQQPVSSAISGITEDLYSGSVLPARR